MGNIGPWQLIIVLAIVLVLFGAKRLPEAARGLGRSLKIFKAETQGLVGGDDDDKSSDDKLSDDSDERTTSSSAQQSQRAVEPPSTAQPQSGTPVNEQSKHDA